ncbi:MAG: 2Fe-2S iron-sulfur cluster-binding protein [Candidatus Sericytochromatia bacterium]
MAKVRFVGKSTNKIIDINKEETILAGALRNNFEIPFGCKYGSCFSCSVEVVKGLENIDCKIKNKDPKTNKYTILTCMSKIKKEGEIVLKI